MSDGQNADDPQYEWEFFVYEEPARYSLWLQRGDEGVCLYDRPPEDHGMWLSPDRDSDYDPSEPSARLKQLLGRLVGQEDVDAADVVALDPHESHFFQVVHGTANEDPESIPDPVWTWMWNCREELVEA